MIACAEPERFIKYLMDLKESKSGERKTETGGQQLQLSKPIIPKKGVLPHPCLSSSVSATPLDLYQRV